MMKTMHMRWQDYLVVSLLVADMAFHESILSSRPNGNTLLIVSDWVACTVVMLSALAEFRRSRSGEPGSMSRRDSLLFLIGLGGISTCLTSIWFRDAGVHRISLTFAGYAVAFGWLSITGWVVFDSLAAMRRRNGGGLG